MTRMRLIPTAVIFHWDYWDPTDIVYRRIPIARPIALRKKALSATPGSAPARRPRCFFISPDSGSTLITDD